jgi:endonuclease/exonuclease/phosphatase family metal-dependent hydrolase
MRKENILLLLALLGAPSMAAQSFVLVSLNTLHYGWGANTAYKDQAIFTVAQAAGADAIVLQEVMPQALLPPGSFNFMVSQNSYGAGSYVSLESEVRASTPSHRAGSRSLEARAQRQRSRQQDQ